MISNAITSKIVGHAFQQLPSPKQTQCSCEVTRVSKSISSAMQLTLQETNTFLQNCFFLCKTSPGGHLLNLTHHKIATCSFWPSWNSYCHLVPHPGHRYQLSCFFFSVPSFFSFFLSFVFDARPDPGLVAALVAGALTFLSIRLGPKQEGGQDVKLDVLHREESWLV